MELLEAVDVVKKLGRGSTGARIGPISLRVEPGTVTALVGRSGSGKSTVLNCVAGLMRPSAGRVIFEGKDIAGASDQRLARLRREAFGFVFQDYTLLDPLTGRENIELPARMSHRRLDREALDPLVQRLGLEGRLSVTTDRLSGGQRQRVAIARAVANGARVLFADEPTGALDPVTRDEVMDLMLGTVADPSSSVKAMLLATHDVELAGRADRVLVLADGVVVDSLDRPGPQKVMAALRKVRESAA